MTEIVVNTQQTELKEIEPVTITQDNINIEDFGKKDQKTSRIDMNERDMLKFDDDGRTQEKQLSLGLNSSIEEEQSGSDEETEQKKAANLKLKTISSSVMSGN